LSTEATTIATQSPPSTSASTEPTTLTTTAEQRLAEVEDLLGDLWFGWFDAIYRKDADALWEVVATTTFHEAGVDAMRSTNFIAPPNLTGVRIARTEILLDSQECLVVSHEADLTAFLGEAGSSEVVSVLWPDDRYGFRFATDWQFRNDLWQSDCDNLEREMTP
jgi:hypothetical protein